MLLGLLGNINCEDVHVIGIWEFMQDFEQKM